MDTARYCPSSATLIKLTCALALALAIGKCVVGALTHSTSIIASALDSVMDLGLSLINLIILKKSKRAANIKFNFGFIKLQAIACLFEGALIALSALFLFYDIFSHYDRSVARLDVGIVMMIVATIASLLISKMLLFGYRANADLVLKSDAAHYESDVRANLGVLLSLFLVYVTGIEIIDVVVGALISCSILYQGFCLIKEGSYILIDEGASMRVLMRLRRILDEAPCSSYHDLKTRVVMDTIYMEVHLVFDKEISLYAAHAISDSIEDAIRSSFTNYHWEITTHLDPE